MNLIRRGNIEKMQLPGRVIQQAVGKGKAVSPSTEMTMGFAHYSEASGPMEPHSHAEEIVYILGAQNGWILYGDHPDRLDHRIDLAEGMTLHIPAHEWHVFQFEEGGHVDIIFFYSTPDIFSTS